MALWDGQTLNTRVAASVVNQFYKNGETQNLVSETSGLVYALKSKNQKTGESYDFAKNAVTKTTGDKLRVKMFGATTTIATVADGAAEIASATPKYSASSFGAATFDLAHYFDLFGAPSSEKAQIVGDDAATMAWLEDRTMEIMASWEETLGVALNVKGVGGTRTVLGNWQHAVSDGVTNVAGFNETTLATYGGLNRADAANVIVRGQIKDMAAAAYGLADIDAMKLKANRKNGKAKGVDLICAGEAQYLRAQTLLNDKNQVQITQAERWRKFGGEYFMYAGLMYACDYKMAADVMGMFDTSTWVLWDSNPDKITNGWNDHPFAPAWIAKVEKFMQLVCVSPANNGKFIRVG